MRRLVVDDQDLDWRGGHAEVSNGFDAADIASRIVSAAPLRSVRLVVKIVRYALLSPFGIQIFKPGSACLVLFRCGTVQSQN